MSKYKTCTKCNVAKPCTNEYFSKHSNNQSGLRPDCKECVSARNKLRYKANSEKLRQYQKDYIPLNREKIRLREKAKYQRNREQILLQVKNRYKENPEVVKVSVRNRRARKAKVPSEPYTWKEIVKIHGHLCWLCGEAIDLQAPRKTGKPGWESGLHLDHVIPIVMNGPDLKWNVQPTHGLCNLGRKKRP